ncbi:unnamed protein product [Protopolystoma xenopodis]|uniref:Uncharacterized protein n=1 Tax=Protopolystoma xenopodis TaxID=117903 RepID=A0A448XBF2_9PLAT|nr:unnamed protein product [Protopolystoma xenopodis]
MNKIKTEAGLCDRGPLQVTDKNRSRLAASSLSREPSFEEQQLQRELDAIKEREVDLSEQLRFSEEELEFFVTMTARSDDVRHIMDDSLAPFTEIEENCLGNSVNMNLPVKPNDSWSGETRRRLLVEPTFESLHPILSLEMEAARENMSSANFSPLTGFMGQGSGEITPRPDGCIGTPVASSHSLQASLQTRLEVSEEENTGLQRRLASLQKEAAATHGELMRLHDRLRGEQMGIS